MKKTIIIFLLFSAVLLSGCNNQYDDTKEEKYSSFYQTGIWAIVNDRDGYNSYYSCWYI